MTQDSTSSTASGSTTDIPTQVFEQFLQALHGAELRPEMIARLHKTLLQDKNFTEHALKDAVLSEEPLP